jgi:hypothetical protein
VGQDGVDLLRSVLTQLLRCLPERSASLRNPDPDKNDGSGYRRVKKPKTPTGPDPDSQHWQKIKKNRLKKEKLTKPDRLMTDRYKDMKDSKAIDRTLRQDAIRVPVCELLQNIWPSWDRHCTREM